MKRKILSVSGFIVLLGLTTPLSGKEVQKDIVDSGSFGIFANGRRVATETFSVHQGTGAVSTITSQIKEEGNPNPSQSSSLQIMSDGSLVRYEWHDLGPSKAEVALEPNGDFLKETITQAAGNKPAEHPFLMPKTSVVLDNNFFVYRQVLAWRYMASSCTVEGDQEKCTAASFGTIIPQEQISTRVSVQLIGADKISIRGVERQLIRLTLKSDDDEWAMWLDPADHFKLVRVTKSGINMEVVRD